MHYLRLISNLFLMVFSVNSFAGTMGELIDPWSGFYFGLSAEAGAGPVNQSNDLHLTGSSINSLLPGSIISASIQSNAYLQGQSRGGMANLFAGYNSRSLYHYPNFIYGLQLSGNIYNNFNTQLDGEDFSLFHTDTRINGVPFLFFGDEFSRVSAQIRPTEIVTLAARAGLLVRPETLLYGLIGASEGYFRYHMINTRPSGSALPRNLVFADSLWNLGLFTGAGLEQKINEHWSLLFEYHFMRFNFNQDLALPQTLTSNNNTGIQVSNSVNQTVRTTYSLNLGSVGIAYRF